jgi:ketosteroid isomerase-like protein
VTSDNVVIAKAAYAAYARGGVEAILEFADPKIEWEMTELFAGKPTTFRGHDGVRKVIKIFEENIDDFAIEPLEFIEAGDNVVVSVRLHGTGKGTDHPVEFRIAHVWTTVNGLAIRFHSYLTKEDALAVLGVDG